MDFFESPDKAQECTTSALALIAEHKLRPTPKSFAVCYAFYADEYRALKEALNALFEDGGAFTEAKVDELFGEHFEMADAAAAIQETGTKMEQTVSEVSETLNRAGAAAKDFGKNLDEFQENLSEDKSTEEIRGLVGDMKSKTEKMKERNKALEIDLGSSSEDISKAREKLETSLEESMIDPLTGIANQHCFSRFLWDHAKKSMAENLPLSLLMVSVDCFNEFVDTHGSQVGDEVLKLVGGILSHKVRDEDMAAHYERERFSVALVEVSLDDALEVARKIATSVAKRKLVNRDTGDDYGSISLSIGAVLFNQVEYMPKLMERGGEMLADAVKRGGNMTVSDRGVTLNQ